MEDNENQSQKSLLGQKRTSTFRLEAIQEHLVAPKVGSKKFRVQGKNIFLTYPRCSLRKERVMEKLKLKRKTKLDYMTVAQENHEDGSKHLHALLSYNSKQDITLQNAFDLSDDEMPGRTFHPNIQSVRNSEAVHRYVQKEGNFVEDGSFVTNLSKDAVKKHITAQANAILLSKPIEVLVREGTLKLQHVPTVMKAVNAIRMLEQPKENFVPRIGLWITGAPGIGKSRWVRSTFGSLVFNKPQSKWWDGYKGEKVVVLDDLDLVGSCLGHHLKIWGDNYGFNAEIKGDTIQPQHSLFIITSNYTPGEVFTLREKEKEPDCNLVDAIKRRFLMCTISGGELVAYESGYSSDPVFSKIKDGDVVNWKELLLNRKDQQELDVEIQKCKDNEEEAKDFFANLK
jgi:hypothetical protein